MKHVIYYCPGCRKQVTREVKQAYLRYESFCATAGRVISMRRIKDQAAARRKLIADSFRL